MIDQDKLFEAYEECRADNTAHLRKILELQKQNEKLMAALDCLRRYPHDIRSQMLAEKALAETEGK